MSCNSNTWNLVNSKRWGGSFPGHAFTSILTVILPGRSHDDTPAEEETGFTEAVLGAPEPFLTGAAALDWFLCVQASRGGPQAPTPPAHPSRSGPLDPEPLPLTFQTPAARLLRLTAPDARRCPCPAPNYLSFRLLFRPLRGDFPRSSLRRTSAQPPS